MSGSYDEVRYQVFVSSTFTDLKDERDKVLQAILECKAFPTGMELFPSADDEQFDFIKREIDSSDYYLVIVAGRYGSLADDGLSFTEKEFDYARARGKPIMAFLIKDLTKLPFGNCEMNDEGRTKLEQFREKARKSRLVKYFDNPDELKSQVLQSLNYQFKVNPKQGWVPAGQSKRDDLEDIRNLLSRVLTLEAENAELKSQRKDATALLGQGQDAVSWKIDVTRLVVIIPSEAGGPASRIHFPSNEAQLHTDWDELLYALYPGGSSRLDSSDVERRLLQLLARKISDPSQRATWRMWVATNSPDMGLDLRCFWEAKRDIYTQLTGLGLIEEFVENRYKGPLPGNSSMMLNSLIGSSFQTKPDPTPVQVVVWRLTRRGEEQLALISGFRRSEPS